MGAGSLLPLEGAITAEVERERRSHLTSLQRFEDLADAPAGCGPHRQSGGRSSGMCWETRS